MRENLERYFERTRKDAGPDRMSGREVLEKFKRKENGRTTYHIPKILIESLVQFKGEARRESNRKGAKTKEIARAKNPNTKAVKTRQQKSSV